MSNKVVIYQSVEGHVAPKRANEGDAGYDLTAHSYVYEKANGYYTVDLGTKIHLPSGYWAQLYARSSLAKRGWRLANGVGIIDNGYRGPLKAILEKRHDKAEKLESGEVYVQLVIYPNPYVDMKPGKVSKETERGEEGFGSTTKKKVSKKVEESEDEEEEKPKRSSKKKVVDVEDDEEEKPKKGSKKKAADEEEKPKKSSKKKAAEESDDEEEKPARRSSKKKVESDDEDTKKSSKKSGRSKSSAPVSDDEE